MKKLVPFKKDIVFDNNIDEINSISLEYEIDEKQASLISGKFIVSGDYKMTSTSENLDVFEYKLPFNINIDKKYDIDNADVEINDFYYEVINSKILSVNIEMAVSNVEEREVSVMDRCVDITDDNEEIETEDIISDNNEIIGSENSLFDNLDDNETYTTYKVHIVTENDTLETIIMNYAITKEKLDLYNNLSDIKIGDKLIIPANEN